MALESRKNRHTYYYRKERSGDQVRSVYLGSGLIAELTARHAEEAEAQRLAEREHERQVRAAFLAADAPAADAIAALRTTVHAALLLAGYHQHKRQWRRKRGMMTEALTLPDTHDQVRALLKRCDTRKPLPADVLLVRRLFAEQPDRAGAMIDLAYRTEKQLIDSLGATALTAEALRAGCDRTRASLGDRDAPALERLLIDAICLAWLRLWLTEQAYTVAMEGPQTLTLCTYWERRLTQAQGRYLRACEALARVRRLAVPALIQNNALQQVVNITQQEN